ncbi:hypothetical protein K7H20_21970 [Salipiger manganoxidans]|uniref:hypothetical protein n=1 Tax=Salipiger marinus TaxID=555512 RepID=UPI001E344858|nr:hypothetical protein [Salipiger manganoxidans]MCD1620732.1 hypothetical protein [Salipiger manganoxidans]
MALTRTIQEVVEGTPVDPNKRVVNAQLSTLMVEMRTEYQEIGTDLAALEAEDLPARVETLEAGQAGGFVAAATWTGLLAITPSVNGTAGEVPDSDTGTHSAASGTGYDGATVDNAGRYAWNASWGRWVRISDTGLSGKADADAVVALTGDQTVAGVKTFSAAPVVPDGAFPLAKITGAAAAADLTAEEETRAAQDAALLTEVDRRDTADVGLTDDATDPADDVAIELLDGGGNPLAQISQDGRWSLDRATEYCAPGAAEEGLTDAAGHPVLMVGEDGTRLHGAEDVADVFGSGADGSRTISITDASGVTQLTTAAADGDCFAPRITLDRRAVRYVSDLTGTVAPFVIGRDGKSRMLVGDGVLRAVYGNGQSLMAGVQAGTPTAITTTPLYPGANLMSLGADDGTTPRIITDPTANSPDERTTIVDYDVIRGLVDLREGATAKCGETLLSRAGAQLQAAGGYAGRYPLVFQSFAVGGSSYAWLTPSGYIWANLCRTAHLHKRIANDFGMRFEIAAYIWVHGHSNAGATQAEYLGYLEEQEAALAQLCADLGQTTKPAFITTGTATSKFGSTTRCEVPLAQLEFGTAASDLSTRVFAGPEYTIEIGADGTHPTAEGYQDLGDMIGIAVRQALFGGYTPFRATGATGAGTDTVTVSLTGADGAVVLDTSLVSDPGGHGFRVYSDSGEATITGVSIVGGAVEITLSAALGTNAYVDYALSGIDGASGGPTTGPRGCVRDSRAGTLSSGVPAHRYLPADTLPIS